MALPPLPMCLLPPHHTESPYLSRGISATLISIKQAQRDNLSRYKRPQSQSRGSDRRRRQPDHRRSLDTARGFSRRLRKRAEITALDEARQQNSRQGVPLWMVSPLW